MSAATVLNRRDFLKTSAVGSAALVVGFHLSPSAFAATAEDQEKKPVNPFDAWIRESDGYPLKYVIAQQGNTLTLTFDKYNTGAAIAPPPASQVVQG